MDKEKQAQNWMDVELERPTSISMASAYCCLVFKQGEQILNKGLDIVYEIEMKTLQPFR